MQKSYSLSKEALLTLSASAGTRVAVQSGVVWFTAAGADVVLGRGHDYQLAMDEALLIQALADTRFTLTSQAPRSRLQGRLASLLSRRLLAGS